MRCLKSFIQSMQTFMKAYNEKNVAKNGCGPVSGTGVAPKLALFVWMLRVSLNLLISSSA